VTKGVNEDNLGLSRTSGSTGEPLKFYTDTIREGPALYAAFILNKEAMGIEPFKKINELEIKTIPHAQTLDVTKEVKIKKGLSLKNLFLPKIIGISTLDIKRENYDRIIKIIKANKIETIYGYPSSILPLAQHLSKNENNIKMKYIYTIGEEVLEHERRIISTNFHCPVYIDYSAAECLRMGFECKYQHGFHMDIYNYFFEYIKDNNYAKNNEIGDVVVTSLNNYVFPFIRYRLGDRVQVSNMSCKCNVNFQMVEKVYGRVTDPFITPSGKDLKLIFFEEFELLYDYVNQFQVIQIKNDELLVKIVPNDSMNEDKRINIEKRIHELTEESMKVTVILVPEISLLKTGKKRAIITKKEYEKLIKNGEIL
jgi:phenylacetate-CoA ligase